MLVVSEGLLDDSEVNDIRLRLANAQWEDGRQTAGGFALGAKDNLQLRDGAEPAVSIGAFILGKLWAHPLFISAALPKTIYPPRFNRYASGQTYGAHVDSALMRPAGSDQMLRTDLSAKLFLTDPADYDGGELEIETGFGAQIVKLAAGDLVLYPASSLHQVTPVTRGERLASFFWIQSAIGDDRARTLLFDLDQNIQRLSRQLNADNAELKSLTGIYHNLLRRWAVI